MTILPNMGSEAPVSQVRIKGCTSPHAWWGSHVGRIINVLFVDEYGYWTRDTEIPGADGWDGYRPGTLRTLRSQAGGVDRLTLRGLTVTFLD